MISVEFTEFPTHVRKSKSKKDKAKRVKINGQQLYSGNMNPFTRAVVVDQMHEFISNNIPDLDLSNVVPIEISLEVHSPINMGDVRFYAGKGISWKPPKKDYEPSWDIDNLWIWIKCFTDVLVKKGFIPDDNIKYVRSNGKVSWIECLDLDSRKLVYHIKKFE